MLTLELLIIICLAYIFYQDMKYRAVYWILFPVLALGLFSIKYSMIGWIGALTDTSYALAFFSLQLFLLWLYFSVKKRRLTDITVDYLGLGDILLLVSIAFYLSPLNYILFYTGSLILVLIYACIIQQIESVQDKRIPLAGLQAAFMMILILCGFVFPQMKLYEDLWLQAVLAHLYI